MQPDTLDVLEDISEAAGFIMEDTVGATLESFLLDRRMRQLVERNFMIMGAAVNRLRRDDPDIASQIDAYERIVAFRNVLIHEYDVIDHEIVWQVIQHNLPGLRVDIDRLITSVSDRPTE